MADMIGGRLSMASKVDLRLLVVVWLVTLHGTVSPFDRVRRAVLRDQIARLARLYTLGSSRNSYSLYSADLLLIARYFSLLRLSIAV